MTDASNRHQRLYYMVTNPAARPAKNAIRRLDSVSYGKSAAETSVETVAWFNGGLFDDANALPLDQSDIKTVLAASDLDWSEVDPSILGTLFERGLRSRQARPARRALHRQGQDHAAGRAGGDPPAARRVGGREDRDGRGADDSLIHPSSSTCYVSLRPSVR